MTNFCAPAAVSHAQAVRLEHNLTQHAECTGTKRRPLRPKCAHVPEPALVACAVSCPLLRIRALVCTLSVSVQSHYLRCSTPNTSHAPARRHRTPLRDRVSARASSRVPLMSKMFKRLFGTRKRTPQQRVDQVRENITTFLNTEKNEEERAEVRWVCTPRQGQHVGHNAASWEVLCGCGNTPRCACGRRFVPNAIAHRDGASHDVVSDLESARRPRRSCTRTWRKSSVRCTLT